jgi:hypothetical protein
MEGLSCFKKENLGELQELQNGRQGPQISHLLFADDIFFTRSDSRSVSTLKEVVDSYYGLWAKDQFTEFLYLLW